MRTRTTTALAAVGIAAIGAALFAVPAQAAQIDQGAAPAAVEKATGDRLEGKLILTLGEGQFWSFGNGDATSIPTPYTTSLATAEANAAVYSIPAVGAGLGPVIDENGLCMTGIPSGPGVSRIDEVFAEPCDGSKNQQWSLETNHTLRHSSASETWPRNLGATDSSSESIARIRNSSHKVVMEHVAPPLDVKDVTAVVDSVNHAEKSAAISGTGEPGTTIVVTTPTGDVTTKVKEDGTWSLTAPGLAEGDNTLPVKQTINGKTYSETTVKVTIDVVELKGVFAVVVSVDHEEKSALISGTGEPGATIVVTTPTGDVTTTVRTDATWSLTAPGLAVGDNTLPVKQVIDGKTQSETSVNVIIEALEVPVAHPAVAAAVVGAGALALIPVIRRRIA